VAWDREQESRSAGLRTFPLVCILRWLTAFKSEEEEGDAGAERRRKS
jgi:hypothetical protein